MAGSHCPARGELYGATEVRFTEHKKGWFYLTHDTKKPNSVVFAVLLNAKNGKVVTLDFFQGTKSHHTSRALLKPGKYVLMETRIGFTIGQGGLIVAKSLPTAKRVHYSLSLSGEFKPLKK